MPFTPEQQAAFDSLPLDAQAAMQKIVDSGDPKTIVMTGAVMALISALHAHSRAQIEHDVEILIDALRTRKTGT